MRTAAGSSPASATTDCHPRNLAAMPCNARQPRQDAAGGAFPAPEPDKPGGSPRASCGIVAQLAAHEILGAEAAP